MRISITGFGKSFIVAGLLFFVCVMFVNADELKTEEIIAKHLESIGTKDKRDAVKNRMAMGLSEFESKLPPRKTTGKSVIVSELNDLLFMSSFNSSEYQYEKIGFFKGSIEIPLALQNSRSPLGTFIADHSVLLSEGLFTGSISSLWNLANPKFRKGRIESSGTKKIDGRKTYVLLYYPRTNSNDFSVKLFFDAENFQHVRTEYRDAVQGATPSFGNLGDAFGAVFTLTEEFRDFKATDGLTLPHSYKIKYMRDSNNGTFEWNWGFKINQYRFNEKLKDNFFSF